MIVAGPRSRFLAAITLALGVVPAAAGAGATHRGTGSGDGSDPTASELAGQTPKFGVNYVYHLMTQYLAEHGGTPEGYIAHQNQKLQSMGALWVRSAGPGDLTSLDWGNLERQQGTFDFTLHDARVRDALSRSLFMLGSVDFSNVPEFARQEGTYFNDARYLEYVNAIVERYDGDGKDDMPGLVRPIKHWEIGNEVINRSMFTGSAEDYAHVLKISFEAIKATCRDCQVLVGGWVVGALGDEARWLQALDYFDRVLAAGGGAYFDIMNFHNYTDDCDFLTYRHADGFRQALAMYGLQKPLWITESNTKLHKEGDGVVVVHTLERQAQDLIKRIVVAFDAGVDVFFWHGLDDTENGPGVGFFDEHETPKPIYYDLKLLMTNIGEMTSVERLTFASSQDVYLYRFDVGKRFIYVLWTEGGDTTLDLTGVLDQNSLDLTYALTELGKTEPETTRVQSAAVPVSLTPAFIEVPKPHTVRRYLN